uniref:Uncharacterized protein n=1 Tax=Onchocerca volvulus TaxID=6282 RepID=A0A8R1TPZ4_ONCVO
MNKKFLPTTVTLMKVSLAIQFLTSDAQMAEIINRIIKNDDNRKHVNINLRFKDTSMNICNIDISKDLLKFWEIIVFHRINIRFE